MEWFTLFVIGIVLGCSVGFVLVVCKIIQDEKEIRAEKARIRLCVKCKQSRCVCK